MSSKSKLLDIPMLVGTFGTQITKMWLKILPLCVCLGACVTRSPWMSFMCVTILFFKVSHNTHTHTHSLRFQRTKGELQLWLSRHPMLRALSQTCVTHGPFPECSAGGQTGRVRVNNEGVDTESLSDVSLKPHTKPHWCRGTSTTHCSAYIKLG